MLHEEKSQPKASGISSETGRPCPDNKPHSQSLQPQIQEGNLQSSESAQQPSGHPVLQREHLYCTHHPCEEDYTDR